MRARAVGKGHRHRLPVARNHRTLRHQAHNAPAGRAAQFVRNRERLPACTAVGRGEHVFKRALGSRPFAQESGVKHLGAARSILHKAESRTIPGRIAPGGLGPCIHMAPVRAIVRRFPEPLVLGAVEHHLGIVRVDRQGLTVSAAHAVAMRTETRHLRPLGSVFVPGVKHRPRLTLVATAEECRAAVVPVAGSCHHVNYARFLRVNGNGFNSQKTALGNIDPVHHRFPASRRFVPAVRAAHVRAGVEQSLVYRRGNHSGDESATAHAHVAPAEISRLFGSINGCRLHADKSGQAKSKGTKQSFFHKFIPKQQRATGPCFLLKNIIQGQKKAKKRHPLNFSVLNISTPNNHFGSKNPIKTKKSRSMSGTFYLNANSKFEE